MSCFQDMTFCSAFTDGRCVNFACDRAFTDEQRAQAERWWGGPGAPVALSNFWDRCKERVEQ